MLAGPGLAIAQLANINPIKDNTLYQYVAADGDRSNALGNHFFAGETAMSELRRGVLAFDIAGNVPAGSTILGVTLSLNMSRTGSDTPRNVELHKLKKSGELFRILRPFGFTKAEMTDLTAKELCGGKSG